MAFGNEKGETGAMSKHAEAVHEAQAHWEGGLTDGSGLTSPEELLAAAHATCFSMALAFELQGRNAAPRSLDVTARVGFDPKVGGGYEVSFSELTVKGDVPGIGAEDFREAVSQAAEGCPISQALKGNVQISAEAELA
jgi:osmotically inducible protein OsmC